MFNQVRLPLQSSYIKSPRSVYRGTRRCTTSGNARPWQIPVREILLSQSQNQRSFHHSPNFGNQIQDLEPAFLDKFKDALVSSKATHEISQLPHAFSNGYSGKEVVLHGYLGARHDLSKKLSFVTLTGPDLKSRIQLVSSPGTSNPQKAIHELLKSLRPHTPVAISGLLTAKPADQQENGQSSQHFPNSNFEIMLRDVQCLNDISTDIIMKEETEFPLAQRYLQLRTDQHLLNALALRSDVKAFCTHKLTGTLGFTEVETPLLFKSTSEGAREFIVPTRRKGLAYALPQSPQQYKQILMASGVRKYYQFAKCFRDEDLRADRQPEFAQLDMEMGFSGGEDVRDQVERLIRHLWSHFLQIELPNPFPCLTYEQAMSEYGSDKPDLRPPISSFTRIEMLLPADLINMISPLKAPVVEAMVLSADTSPAEMRNFVSKFLDANDNKKYLENPSGGPGIFVYDSSKPLHGLSAFGFEAVERIEENLDLEDGSLIILQARPKAPLSGGSIPLGDLRTDLFKAAVESGLLKSPSWSDFRPLWIIDFPLFTLPTASEPGQGGHAGLASTHHPFTSPKTAADIDSLLTNPGKAIGDHYDLVINGEEIGGGSRRIHHAEMQEFIFRDVLKMDQERINEFAHLMAALRSGCPPHAGIALGFDRLIAMMHAGRTGRKTSVRDVIAFSKSGSGEDMMVKSPSLMSQETLETYHLRLRD